MEVVFPALEVVSKREHLSCGKPCLSPHTRLQQTNKPIISTRIFFFPVPIDHLTHPFFHIPHPSSRNSGRPYRLIRPGHPAPWDQNTPQNRTTNISPRIPSSPLKTHFLPPTITTTLLPLLTFNTAPLALCDRLSFTLHQDLTKATPSTKISPKPLLPRFDFIQKDMHLLLILSAILSFSTLVASSPIMCPDVRSPPFPSSYPPMHPILFPLHNLGLQIPSKRAAGTNPSPFRSKNETPSSRASFPRRHAAAMGGVWGTWWFPCRRE